MGGRNRIWSVLGQGWGNPGFREGDKEGTRRGPYFPALSLKPSSQEEQQGHGSSQDGKLASSLRLEHRKVEKRAARLITSEAEADSPLAAVLRGRGSWPGELLCLCVRDAPAWAGAGAQGFPGLPTQIW